MKPGRSNSLFSKTSLRMISVGTMTVIFATASTDAQGTFRNMDFGLSQVPNTQPWGSVVPTSQAFPFWSVYFGANQVTSVGYNVQAINQAFVGLLTPDNTAEGAIAGHNTAVIQAGNLGFQ